MVSPIVFCRRAVSSCSTSFAARPRFAAFWGPCQLTAASFKKPCDSCRRSISQTGVSGGTSRSSGRWARTSFVGCPPPAILRSASRRKCRWPHRAARQVPQELQSQRWLVHLLVSDRRPAAERNLFFCAGYDKASGSILSICKMNFSTYGVTFYRFCWRRKKTAV